VLCCSRTHVCAINFLLLTCWFLLSISIFFCTQKNYQIFLFLYQMICLLLVVCDAFSYISLYGCGVCKSIHLNLSLLWLLPFFFCLCAITKKKLINYINKIYFVEIQLLWMKFSHICVHADRFKACLYLTYFKQKKTKRWWWRKK